jgi:hypothetical protein
VPLSYRNSAPVHVGESGEFDDALRPRLSRPPNILLIKHDVIWSRDEVEDGSSSSQARRETCLEAVACAAPAWAVVGRREIFNEDRDVRYTATKFLRERV